MWCLSVSYCRLQPPKLGSFSSYDYDVHAWFTAGAVDPFAASEPGVRNVEGRTVYKRHLWDSQWTREAKRYNIRSKGLETNSNCDTLQGGGWLTQVVFSTWWGDTSGGKMKGVITYTQSPFRQNPTAHMFRGYLFNGFRRLAGQMPYWIVPVAIGYGTFTWAKSHDEYQNSKAGHMAKLAANPEAHH
ncbi:hypothetical protein FIBSPDRAFT_936539 [Athelia psychrophila]|uniref:Cytochrome b-c1 complex subunit 8 n=1 Tax=Athelia psychrophila TaxID=1759441 RepID=A0A166BX02_9AGAM|nr:hypothetical protein FIBSPDRAFT_936539 [Fibularhizoctonia sp. CBS 109695]